MKLSEVGGDAKPVKLSDIPDAPATPAGPPSLLDSALKPVKAIPGAVADEFRAGKKQFDDAARSDTASYKAGQPPGWRAGGTLLGGMMQELFSPITGTAKAVSSPFRTEIPGPVGEALANTGELAVSMTGPAAISKSLGMMSKMLPGYSEAVQKLMAAGVRLTPGQIAQGWMKRGEDSVRSFPGAGYIVAQGQYHALEDFNRAVLNETLKPIGATLPKDVEIGPKAIAATEKIIGQKYDALTPKLTFDAGDKALKADVDGIVAKNTKSLPEPQQKQFKAVLDDIEQRVQASGTGLKLDGYTYRQIDSELGYLYRKYAKSQDPSHQLFADSLGDLQGAMRDALERANPAHAAELQDLNASWAAFKRAQGASIRRVSSNGVFSAADLLADIKKSSSQGTFARGDGLLQDLASAGQHVLPSTVPDSGTMQRALWAELIATGGAAALERPDVLAGMATVAGPYTKPGMSLVNKAAKGLPNAASAANRTLRSPMLGIAAGLTDEQAQP